MSDEIHGPSPTKAAPSRIRARVVRDATPPPTVCATCLEAGSLAWLGWLTRLPEIGDQVEIGPELERLQVVDVYEGGSLVVEGTSMHETTKRNTARCTHVVLVDTGRRPGPE